MALEKILSIGQTPVVFISVFVICFIGYAIGSIKVKGRVVCRKSIKDHYGLK